MTNTPTQIPIKGRTRNPSIPWKDYADGRTWTLRLGEDFHGQIHRAVAAARTWAWKNGYQLKVTGHQDGVSFSVVFTLKNPPTGPHTDHPWQWAGREDVAGKTWDRYTCPGCEATKSEPLRPGSLL